MLRPHRQAKLTLRFDAHDKSEKEIFARIPTFPLGGSQESTRHGASGVDDGIKMRVVVIMNVRRNPIKKCGMLGIDSVRSAQKRCGGLTEEGT